MFTSIHFYYLKTINQISWNGNRLNGQLNGSITSDTTSFIQHINSTSNKGHEVNPQLKKKKEVETMTKAMSPSWWNHWPTSFTRVFPM